MFLRVEVEILKLPLHVAIRNDIHPRAVLIDSRGDY